MYERHFGLQTEPFSLTPDPAFLYLSPGHCEALAALKIGVDDLETGWLASTHHTLVTDPDGIVFMATDPVWRYRGLLPLTPDRIARTKTSRRYADTPLYPLGQREAADNGRSLVTLAGSDGIAREYLAVNREMPGAGWTGAGANHATAWAKA